MFTGIIKERGRIKSLNGGVLSVSAPDSAKNAYKGQSIAVNGVCLTVKKISSPSIYFDYTPATLSATALKYLNINDEVNIEPAISVGSDLSGHFVLGHVDGLGRIAGKTKNGNSVIVGIKIINSTGDDIKKYLINKGSVSVDGISLTINNVSDDEFSVSVIPVTFQETNLKNRRIGDYVNLETDIIEKTVVKRFDELQGSAALSGNGRASTAGGGLTYDFLSENGFI